MRAAEAKDRHECPESRDGPHTFSNLRVRRTDAGGLTVDSNIFSITVGTATTYSFTSSPMFNNTTQLQLNNVSVNYTFFPGGIIGSLSGITPVEGTATTHVTNGTLTVSGLAASGPGTLFVFHVSTSAVFYETVTAA